MKPAPFAYHRPGTAEEALDLLARHPDAKPLAGGQSLIPAMNFRLAAPARLVDLNGLANLAGIEAEGPAGGLRLGAMTRHRALERSSLVALHAPLLAEAVPYIAHPQIRNRGTIGGSLAHADPAAELPAVMVALGADLILRSATGERRLEAAGFFTGLFATALAPGELLTAIAIPRLPPGGGSGFEEFSRRHGDYALVGVVTVLVLGAGGSCRDARIVLFSVGDGPVSAVRAATALVGQIPTEAACRDAAELAATEDIDPPSDIHASTQYRRQLARVLTRRALTRAAARARGEL